MITDGGSMKVPYEETPEYDAPGYRIRGWDGIAWYVLGYELAPDRIHPRVMSKTGKLVMSMVGDDRHFVVDPRDVSPLSRDDFCGGCGQIGCKADRS